MELPGCLAYMQDYRRHTYVCESRYRNGNNELSKIGILDICTCGQAMTKNRQKNTDHPSVGPQQYIVVSTRD